MGVHANNRDARLSRIYCDGATWREENGGASQGQNPWSPGTNAQENAAWDQGWVDRDNGTVDQSMCGYPVTGAESPELSEVRY